VRTAIQLLTVEQGTIKALADAVAVLQLKVDALQQRSVGPVPMPAARRPLVPTPARRPAPPTQLTPSPEPDQAEPGGAGISVPR
jgi:hypothetical protein